MKKLNNLESFEEFGKSENKKCDCKSGKCKKCTPKCNCKKKGCKECEK